MYIATAIFVLFCNYLSYQILCLHFKMYNIFGSMYLFNNLINSQVYAFIYKTTEKSYCVIKCM